MVDGHGQSSPGHSAPQDHAASLGKDTSLNMDSQAARRCGGLYDHFQAYRTPADSDYSALLTQGMIVLDTNVLLDLYRYNKEACDDLLSILDRLNERLWIPHQVMNEFWRNREEVLQDKRGTVKIIRTLRAQCATAITELNTWAKRAALPKENPAGLVEILTGAFESVIGKIADHADIDADQFCQ